MYYLVDRRVQLYQIHGQNAVTIFTLDKQAFVLIIPINRKLTLNNASYESYTDLSVITMTFKKAIPFQAISFHPIFHDQKN